MIDTALKRLAVIMPAKLFYLMGFNAVSFGRKCWRDHSLEEATLAKVPPAPDSVLLMR
jgi:hypothetical protein